jgi:hypothetical protein
MKGRTGRRRPVQPPCGKSEETTRMKRQIHGKRRDTDELIELFHGMSKDPSNRTV